MTALVVSRKKHEELVIQTDPANPESDIRISIADCKGSGVRLKIQASPETKIYRQELEGSFKR